MISYTEAALARAQKVADEFYSVPEALRCPRPINGAGDLTMKWCKENGNCGCEDREVLRRCYGESVYPEGECDEKND